jgi:hypothetical protein
MRCLFVIPAKAGILFFNQLENVWTPVPRLNPAGTSFTGVTTFCEFINVQNQNRLGAGPSPGSFEFRAFGF